ncbi:MAG: T9SS type A sorting domain-containing protein [Crocinitomicaceae bacterium]
MGLWQFHSPPLNQRYSIAPCSIFANVIATDSCYYVSGMRAYSSGLNFQEGAFIKFNLDGTIAQSTYFANDTIGYIFWESPNLIKTLDGNFAQTFTVAPHTGHLHFGFIKLKPNGDTLLFKTYLNLYEENNDDWVVQPGGFLQDPIDSAYYGTVNVSRYSDLVGGTALFKLSKTGEFLWHKTFYGTLGNYRIFKGNSLIKIAPDRLMIGGTRIHTPAANSDFRLNTKLVIIDTLGNEIQSKVLGVGILADNCNGLIQTIDGGFIYGGKNGEFVQNGNAMVYRGIIIKLAPNLNEEWRIEDEEPSGESRVNFENILKINDSNFVAVGRTIDTTSINSHGIHSGGRLLKFNLTGDIIWDRNYQRVQFLDNENNIPTHILYDVDMTADSGFVMVGQAINSEASNPEPVGQLGWLVKTDKYGCLVPGCQEFDNPDTTDTVITPPDPEIGLKVYPNPAKDELYIYYASQNHTGNAIASLFNMQGQIVSQWPLNTNYTTYMLDVEHYAKGTYVLKILDGEAVLKVEKVIFSE